MAGRWAGGGRLGCIGASRVIAPWVLLVQKPARRVCLSMSEELHRVFNLKHDDSISDREAWTVSGKKKKSIRHQPTAPSLHGEASGLICWRVAIAPSQPLAGGNSLLET